MATWQDYEGLARDDLAERLGEAHLTGSGTDEGVDVRAPGHVAQVKAQLRPVGRPDLQRLQGAAAGHSPVFYALGGYTAEATAYADKMGMALFEFTATGLATPVNDMARDLGILSGDEWDVLDRYELMSGRCEDGRHCAACGTALRRRNAEDTTMSAGPYGAYRLLLCDNGSCREGGQRTLDQVADVMEAREARDPNFAAYRQQQLLPRRLRALVDQAGMAWHDEEVRGPRSSFSVTDAGERVGIPGPIFRDAEGWTRDLSKLQQLFDTIMEWLLDDVNEARASMDEALAANAEGTCGSFLCDKPAVPDSDPVTDVTGSLMLLTCDDHDCRLFAEYTIEGRVWADSMAAEESAR